MNKSVLLSLRPRTLKITGKGPILVFGSYHGRQYKLEHQSTINPNMALRLLMYIARVYEKILGDKNIYTTKALAIPQPEFFVLYNGDSAAEPYVARVQRVYRESEGI